MSKLRGCRSEVAVGKATLSHHMKTLRQSGLIMHRKEGTRCYVSLRSDIDRVFPGLLDSILNAAQQWETKTKVTKA